MRGVDSLFLNILSILVEKIGNSALMIVFQFSKYLPRILHEDCARYWINRIFKQYGLCL